MEEKHHINKEGITINYDNRDKKAEDQVNVNVLERIKGSIATLSKSHKEVANYVLLNYENTVFLTSAKLARLCRVSESTVTRFAVSLGYSGFAEMQHELQEMVKTQFTMVQRLKGSVKNQNGDIQTLNHLLHDDIESIRKTLRNTDQNILTQAVDTLWEAQRVYVIGARSAYGLAFYFGFALNWIRKDVFIVDGLNINNDKLMNITEKDAVVAISLPRYPRTCVNTLEIAFKRGAQTIAITDSYTSPLVKFARMPLLVHTKTLSFPDNYAPVMSLLGGLLTIVASKDKEKTSAYLEEYERYWAETGVYC